MTITTRTDADLAFHEDTIIAALAAHLTEHRHIVLRYSGGAESGLLLHLFRPMRERLTVVWVNPGALPHEAEHVRAQAAGGPFVEIPSDRAAFWRVRGFPAQIVPVERAGLEMTDTPTLRPIAPANLCCVAVRARPFHDWGEANGATLQIIGQRLGEGTGWFLPGLRTLPHWAPLAAWSRAEVMRRVAHHGVPLPIQYAEGSPRSFECAVCPADLDPARLGFLRRHYPAEHAETLRLARMVLDDVQGELAQQTRLLAEAEGAPE